MVIWSLFLFYKLPIYVIWCLKKADSITVSTTWHEEVIKKYPVLGELYAALKEFHEIMFSQKPEKFGKWLENMEKMDILEISSFVGGTNKDIIAAQNSIAYEYNNGLADGSVNEVKVIKGETIQIFIMGIVNVILPI